MGELRSAHHERPLTAERQLAAEGRGGGAPQLRPSEDEIPEAVRAAFSRPQTGAAGRPTPPPLGGDGAAEPLNLAGLQDYSVVVHPAGRRLKLVMLSTWGDGHYIGLNGVQVLNPHGDVLRLDPTHIRADPPSIGGDGLSGQRALTPRDPRTVDKLLDGVDATYDDRHMFLAPFTPGRSNSIWIDLPPGEAIGVVRFWNYSKTATRGVRSFELLLDGALLYQGSMRPAPVRVGSALAAPTDFVQSVLFTDAPALLQREAAHVYNKQDLEDGLLIYDNGTKLAGDMGPRPEDVARPTTSAVGAAPPTARRGVRPPLRSMVAPPPGTHDTRAVTDVGTKSRVASVPEHRLS